MTWDRWVAYGFALWLLLTAIYAAGWWVGRRALLLQVESAFADPDATEWQRPGRVTRWCDRHDIPWDRHYGPSGILEDCVRSERRVGPA